jgi:hypothetical protein
MIYKNFNLFSGCSINETVLTGNASTSEVNSNNENTSEIKIGVTNKGIRNSDTVNNSEGFQLAQNR